jgi:hypothetical protein
LPDLLKNPAGTNSSGVELEVFVVDDPAGALAGTGLTSAQPGNSTNVMHRHSKLP